MPPPSPPPAPAMRSIAARGRARGWILAGFLAFLVAMAVVWAIGLPPYFAGRSIGRWIDSLGPSYQPNLRTVLDRLPARHALADSGPEVLPALENEVRQMAAAQRRLRQRYAKAQQIQNALYRGAPGGFANWIANWIPTIDPDAENTLQRRLHWGGALLVALSPDPASALDRLDALATSITNDVRLGLSEGFAAIQDPGRRYSDLLGRRLRSGSGELRPFWISCLGHLGDQAAHEGDYLRGIAREPSSEAQRQAILALGSLDSRPDTAWFLVTNLETHVQTELLTGRPLPVLDPEVQRSTVIALWLMGGRAAPAREFLEDTSGNIDPSIAVFARLALTNLIEPGKAPR